MLNTIWGLAMLFSLVCALITGRMQELSDAVFSGAQQAVEISISMLGMMCLWTGLMKIADAGGITALLSKLLSPVMRRLFPEYSSDSPAIKAICMNVTANFLGLGNAATPLGIKAMKEMQKLNPQKEQANNSMVMFVVLNTASIQLIPTTIAVLRKNSGSLNPFDILPAIWVTSLCALLVGVIMAKLLQKRDQHE